MAIEWVKEIWAGRDGEIDERAIRRYRRRWLVKMDNITEGPLAATNTSALPSLYTHYRSVLGGHTEFDLGSTLRRLHPFQRQDDPFYWDVDGEYSSEITPLKYDPLANWETGGATEQGSEDENNPLLRPSDIVWEDFHVMKAVFFDLNGDAFVAKNGEKLDPPAEMQIDGLALTIKRNEANFDNDIAFEYSNTLNTDAVGNFQYHEARVAKITGESRYERDFGSYWTVTYRVEFLPALADGSDPALVTRFTFNGHVLTWWDDMRLNHGSYYISGGERFDFVSKNGGLLSGGLLTAAGDALPVGGTPNYIVFKTRFDKAFAPLGLPI